MRETDDSAAVARVRKLIDRDDEFNVNHCVIGLIRELRNHQPISQESISVIVSGSDQELLLRVLKWLANERILSTSNGNVQLTAAGYQSLTIAANSDELLSQFLSGRKSRLGRKEADRALLLILKTFFELSHT